MTRTQGSRSPELRTAQRMREFLSSTDLFNDLPDEALDYVLERAEWVDLSSGETLFHQGDPGDAMFLVVSGRVQVVVESAPGVEEVVREMGHGENLGELALLTDDPRSATIRAVRDSQLLRLSRDSFQALLREHSGIALQLTRILARWVREGNRRAASRGGVATIAVVPGSPAARHIDFARALAGALSRHGATLFVDAACVDEHLGSGSARAPEESHEHRRVTEWLNLQELDHRFLVYAADPEPSAWSRRCRRQADTVLTVVHPGGQPELGRAMAKTGRTDPDRRGRAERLVLVHPPGTQSPTGTAEWLDRGNFDAHHHVREDRPEDTARLARHLAGRAIGLVLGGGGARGFAHVGIVRALREAGFELDRFGGTSMGSLVAGLFASGRSAAEVQDALQSAWDRVGHRPHRNRTFPAYALDTGERVRRMLGWPFGEQRIEDLWYPFYCTTASLTTGEPVVHRRGSVARWIEASVSIPGVVPPAVADDGELLVDGALLNSLPAGVMRAEHQGPVVAVSVSADDEPRVRPGTRHAPSGWEALFGKLLPFRRPPEFPNILRVLHRSAVIGSIHFQRGVRDDVDLYLEPPLAAYDMFSWRALAGIVEAGYRYTIERLEAEPEAFRALAAPQFEGAAVEEAGHPGPVTSPEAMAGGAAGPQAESLR